MFRRIALTTAVALGAGIALAPVASADESNGIDIVLAPRTYIGSVDDGWRGYPRRVMSFTVEVTDIGEQDDDGLSVFVSVPFAFDGFLGDRWDCRRVDGGAQCEIADLVVPGETWPILTIKGYTAEAGVHDTVDVCAESTNGDAHAGVPFRIGK